MRRPVLACHIGGLEFNCSDLCSDILSAWKSRESREDDHLPMVGTRASFGRRDDYPTSKDGFPDGFPGKTGHFGEGRGGGKNV